MLARLLSIVGMALLVFGLALPAAAQNNNAMVRVIHASPDAPAVDVFVDGQAALTNVAFKAVSEYLEVPAGEHKIAVAPAGQGEGAAVITANPTVEAGKAYTVAAVGLLANIKGQVYSDNLSAPADGKAHVRVIHASPDAPAVAVKVADGPTLIESLAFPNASDYLPVDATSYNLQVTPAGANDVVINLANTTLQAGTIYDVIALGQLANISAEVATYTPQASTTGSGAAGGTESGGTTSAANQLPNTGAGDNLSMLLIGLAALALAGGFMLRRRTA
jgi:LPXTG-motif cell wall-anchored protein